MNIFEQLIEFLSGKKTTIATIIGAILIFLQGRGYIQTDVATMISAILVALGLSANIITTAYYAGKGK